jgi:hypothetical protein
VKPVIYLETFAGLQTRQTVQIGKKGGKMKTKNMRLIIAILFCVIMASCISAPKQTVELAEVTDQQIAELQKSHIRFVQTYYDKLREEANNFIERRWTPLFLSKAVQNKKFRKDLDGAYLISNMDVSQISVKWKGQPIPDAQEEAILSGVNKAITDYRGELGAVLLRFSKGAQKQINAMRKKLIAPINSQERMVINEINSAYADLQRSQAAIKGYLSSAVEVKAQQELVAKKLGALTKSKEVMDISLKASDVLAEILRGTKKADDTVDEFLKEMKNTQDNIDNIISGESKK